MKFLTKPLVAAAVLTQATAATAFDHQHARLNEVLSRHVHGKDVDYAAIKRDPSALDAYLSDVKQVSKRDFKSWTEKQEMAFLINVYNAWTLKLVIDHYPVKSIKKIGGLKGPWKMPVVEVFGSRFTLDQIEHEMLRKDYTDARIHFGVNCASVGCPALRHEAYVADKLDAQLRQQGQIFLNDASKNRVTKRELQLSPIFKWFEEDFVRDAGSLPAFVAPFLAADDRAAVLSGKLKVSHTRYDWSLNDT